MQIVGNYFKLLPKMDKYLNYLLFGVDRFSFQMRT